MASASARSALQPLARWHRTSAHRVSSYFSRSTRPTSPFVIPLKPAQHRSPQLPPSRPHLSRSHLVSLRPAGILWPRGRQPHPGCPPTADDHRVLESIVTHQGGTRMPPEIMCRLGQSFSQLSGSQKICCFLCRAPSGCVAGGGPPRTHMHGGTPARSAG